MRLKYSWLREKIFPLLAFADFAKYCIQRCRNFVTFPRSPRALTIFKANLAPIVGSCLWQNLIRKPKFLMQRASKKHTDQRKYSNVRRRFLEIRYGKMFVTRYTLKISTVTELDYRDRIDQVCMKSGNTHGNYKWTFDAFTRCLRT